MTGPTALTPLLSQTQPQGSNLKIRLSLLVSLELLLITTIAKVGQQLRQVNSQVKTGQSKIRICGLLCRFISQYLLTHSQQPQIINHHITPHPILADTMQKASNKPTTSNKPRNKPNNKPSNSSNSNGMAEDKPATSMVHTYRMAGSDTNRKTQTSTLIHRIIEANDHSPPPILIDCDPIYELDEPQQQLYRYFKTNVRCFRCKKLGHHKYACLHQQRCLYCLAAQHPTDRCPQRTVCYNCYRWGHINSDCNSVVGLFCQDCRRRHNHECCFLTKGTEPIKQMFSTDYLLSRDTLRCMSCLQYGHLICSRDLLTQESQTEKRQKERQKEACSFDAY